MADERGVLDPAQIQDIIRLARIPTGLWKPVIWSDGVGAPAGQVYSVQEGRFTKLGDLIVAPFRAQLTTKGAIPAGNITISSAAEVGAFIDLFATYPVKTGTAVEVAGVLSFANLATNWISVFSLMFPGTTYINVVGAKAAVASKTTMIETDIADTTGLSGTIIYQTN